MPVAYHRVRLVRRQLPILYRGSIMERDYLRRFEEEVVQLAGRADNVASCVSRQYKDEKGREEDNAVEIVRPKVS